MSSNFKEVREDVPGRMLANNSMWQKIKTVLQNPG